MPTNVVGELDLATTFRDGLVEEDGDLTVLVNRFPYDLGGTKGVFAGATTQPVTNNTTNYVYLDDLAVLQINTSGYPVSAHIRLARVITSTGVIIKIIDERAFLASAVSASTGQTQTAGEALLAGDLLAGDTSGQVVKASASFAGNEWRVIAAATSAASALDSIVTTVPGRRGPVRFSAAPLAGSNGSTVFLSTSAGLGTLTAPATSGNVVMVVGVLMGADGITTTPDVLLQPQYISRIP